MYRIFSAIIILAFLCIACTRKDERNPGIAVNPDSLKEDLLYANKHVVITEDQQIKDFIRRYGWDMTETGTGLRYLIYEKGTGTKAVPGKLAKMNYEVRLISGDMIYSSKEKGPKEFVIGKGGVESGLEEGILFLHVGDKAKFILPSHLAFGLIGDQDRIPPKSTLIYDIQLLELK